MKSLIFEEKFEGEELDPLKWNYELGEGEDAWKGHQLQYYRKNKENIFIKDNQLHIRAKKENFGNFSYTSSGINTKNAFHFTYGYLQTRIKFPIGFGILPSFRLIGANIDEELWPKCGQINLIESREEDYVIYHSIYWENEETKKEALYDIETYEDDYNEFHTYRLIWTEDKIIMNIDDREYFNLSLSDELKTQAFQNEFYLYISLAVGNI